MVGGGDWSEDRLLPDLVRSAAVYPDHIAIIHGKCRVSYAQFYDRSPEQSDLVEAFSFVRTYRQRYGYKSPDCRLESICLTVEAVLTAPFHVIDREAVKEIAAGNMKAIAA